MADITISKPHSLDTETAKERLREVGENLKKEYGIRSNWNGDVCELTGTGLKKGLVTVTDKDVTIDITLGLLGKAMKSQIEKQINSQFSSVLS